MTSFVSKAAAEDRRARAGMWSVHVDITIQAGVAGAIEQAIASDVAKALRAQILMTKRQLGMSMARTMLAYACLPANPKG